MPVFTTSLGWGAIPVRLALAVVFLAHGSQKLFGAFGGHGIGGTAEWLAQVGFQVPYFWTWIVALTEFIAGLAVLVGLLTRLAGLGLTAVMVVAIITIHAPNGFFLGQGPALGYEFNIALLGLTLCLLIGGGGALSIDAVLVRKSAEPEASPPQA